MALRVRNEVLLNKYSETSLYRESQGIMKDYDRRDTWINDEVEK